MNGTWVRQLKSGSRAGFTLVELLVVLGIIALLVAISVGVLTQVAGTQDEKRNELIVQKVNSELGKHWKAVVDRANEVPVPPGILYWAGNDADRARVMMRFLWLRNEFPACYMEAMTPVRFPFSDLDQTRYWIGGPPLGAGASKNLPPTASPIMYYQDALLMLTGGQSLPFPQDPAPGLLGFRLPNQTLYQLPILQGIQAIPPKFQLRYNPVPIDPANLTPYPLGCVVNYPGGGVAKVKMAVPGNSEASAMLLMALLKPRKGTGGPFNPNETLGPGAIKDTDNDGIPEIVDALGSPLGYWRVPQANADVLKTPNVLDPRGKLVDPVWNNNQSLQNVLQVYLFEDLTGIIIHDQLPLRDLNNLPPSDPKQLQKWVWIPRTIDETGNPIPLAAFAAARYSTVPVVASAGRDRSWGVNWMTMGQVDTTADDNTYSYNQH